MDFVNIGAIGFAQLGSDDYYDKRKIEKQVLIKYLDTDLFKIPDEFQHMCNFSIKKFPYEGSSYEEVVLNYDDDIVDEWAEQEEDFKHDYDGPPIIALKSDRFWEFVNQAERIDLESDELMAECRRLFAEQYKLYVSHMKDVPPIGKTLKDLNNKKSS
jgi:hypothetical protein